MIAVRAAIGTFVLVSAAALGGCILRFDTHDVVGRWVLTRDSRRLFKEGLAGINPSIEFASAGTFSATDIPAELVGSEPDSAIASGHGTWTLGTRRIDADLRLHFVSVNGVPREYGLVLSMRGVTNNPVLTYFRGDPDSAVMIEFERESKK